MKDSEARAARIAEQLNAQEFERYYLSTCPFHDDRKPSLLIFKDGWFRCLAATCNMNGDLYLLENRIAGGVQTKLINRIAWKPPASLFSMSYEAFANKAHENVLQFADTFGWYYRIRGVEDRIEAQRLGWMDGWCTIPIYSEEDKFQGLVLRAGKLVEQAQGVRYYIPPKQENVLYVPDWKLAKEGKYMVVVYGMFDALSLCKLRIPVCTGISGVHFNSDWLDWVRKPIYVFPDKDEEQHGMELVRKLGWRGRLVRFTYPKDMKDPDDVVRAGLGNKIRNAVGS